VVAVAGLLIYICSSAATPMAAALMLKGMSPGTALVILIAGPATSMASLLAVRSMLGTRGLIVYLASLLVGSVGLGLLVDAVWPVMPVVAGFAADHDHAAHAPWYLHL